MSEETVDASPVTEEEVAGVGEGADAGEGAEEGATTEKAPEKPKSKNHESYVKAAEAYTNTPGMTQKAAVESVGLKANAYNCRMTMALVDPELVKERSSNRSPDNDTIKAAAEAYAVDPKLSKKQALEQQGINYNGYRIKKLDKFLEDMEVVPREKKASANAEALHEAAQFKLDNPDKSKRECMEKHGIPYNAYNITKLNAVLATVDAA